MTKLGDVNNYHDLTGLQELKAKANLDPENKAALKKAAEHFESIFIGMMLKSMRSANAVFEKDNPMNSNTTKFFRDMYDQQLATDMASQGSLGLADMIVDQLGGGSDTYQPASTLRNDGDMQRHFFGTLPSAISDAAVESSSHSWMSNTDNPDAMTETGLLAELQQGMAKSMSQAGLVVSAPTTPNSLTPNSTASSSTTPNSTTPKSTTTAAIETDFDSPTDFIERMWGMAKNAAKQIGLNPSVMIAQSALETGWGKHIIKDKNGASSFNLFNVKAHRDWQGEKAAQSTIEFEGGVAVRKTEPFRVYQGFSESFSDFVSFLKSNSRYQGALQNTHDEEQFLQGLQEAGYATDPNYADKIIGILNSDTFKQSIGKFTTMADSE